MNIFIKTYLTKAIIVGACSIISYNILAQPQGSALTTVLDYDSAVAPMVTVGSQSWLGKNLNVDHFSTGDAIPEAKTVDEWTRAGVNKQPVWCYYNNDPAYGRTYGRLYNWYAVTDPRGLAPQGWHIPSDEEWAVTIDFLNYLSEETTAGLSMKSTSGWNENGNGNNGSGMAARPGGGRDANGAFANRGFGGFWWSSSVDDPSNGRLRDLYYNYNKVDRISANKGCGFSVRCLRD